MPEASLPGASPQVRAYMVPITLLAFCLRLIAALVVARTSSAQWLFSQATELGCLANSVLHGQGFSSPFCGQTGPSAFLAPGYPLFVTAIFRLFGPYTMHSAECIVFTQALFGTATIPVVMWTTRRAFGTRPAILAGLLCALNPWLIGLQAVLWETSLSILLITTLVGIALTLKDDPSRRNWYVAACVLTLTATINPSLLLTGLALCLAACVTGIKRAGAPWLAPALLFLALCSIWPARNLRALHAFIPMRSNMGYELWQGNRPDADGFFQAKLHPNVNTAEYQRYKNLGEVAYMREKSLLAKKWIKSHPQRFAALTLKRAACFWFGIGRTRSALLIGSTSGLTLAGLAALVALLRAHWRLGSLFAAPLLVLPLPYYISHPDFRFWCLLAPTLTMLASWGAMQVCDVYATRRGASVGLEQRQPIGREELAGS